jgi:hypothetical protein
MAIRGRNQSFRTTLKKLNLFLFNTFGVILNLDFFTRRFYLRLFTFNYSVVFMHIAYHLFFIAPHARIKKNAFKKLLYHHPYFTHRRNSKIPQNIFISRINWNHISWQCRRWAIKQGTYICSLSL